jgi:AcrR family transcriptional regulator
MIKVAGAIRDNRSIRLESVRMNRELILDTAARLFAETSYDAVSIDDIAKEIGATKGLIYHYFPSKSMLLGEFLLWNHQLFLDSMRPAWESLSKSSEDKLRQVIKAHLDFYFEYPYMLTVVFRTTYLVPADMRRKITRLREAYTKKFCSLIEEVMATGKLVESDGQTLVSSIIALGFYYAYRYRNAGQQRRNELYELIIRLFFR